MPTLLEKPSDVSPPAQLPVDVLESRHRWERWRGVLVTFFIGLLATLAAVALAHYWWHAPGGGKIAAALWAGGILLTGLASAVAWRFAPASLADTAQQMDRNLAAKNRLEAAATLHHSTSPLANAQREETAAYLKRETHARPVRILPWLVGGVLALVAAHLLMLAVWVIPWLFQPAAPAKPVPPPPPKEMPHATIVWKSPEPESKANPIEEVPAVALAQSSSGLRDLSLELSVDGVPKKSVPLPAKPFDQPGKNTIKASIYLDELGVQPYDVVSYFIRAQRITDQKVPDTTSAIQFIQVRPFRDDVTQVPPGTPVKNYALLIRLKLAQLRAIKENFILAHTDLAVTDPVRMKENDRVGKNQGDLSGKTEEIVQAFIQDGLPAEIIDLLRQAEAPMTDASRKILANQNSDALPPQEKALSLIIEVEKFFIKVMGVPKPGPTSDNPNDPFKDKQQHEMKKRFETAAGQLEQLAKNQAKLAKDLGQNETPGSTPADDHSKTQDKSPSDGGAAGGQTDTPPAPGATPGATPGDSGKPVPLPTPQSVDPFGPDSGKGTFAERQARVLQGVETLLNTNDVLPPAVSTALQDAQKHATDAIRQLDQANNADAREPAAAAAQDLQRALTEMNKAGEEQTKLAMEQGQQKLNDLAKQLNDLAKKGAPGTQQEGLADLAAQAKDIQKQLADAADQQQEAGSAEGAQRLNHLANQIATQDITKDLDAMSKTGLDPAKALSVAQRLESLAGQAAQGQTPGKPTAQDIARLVNALEKSRENLARLAEKAGGPGLDTPGVQPPNSGPAGAMPGQDQGNGQNQKPGAQQGQGQDQKPDAQQGQGQDQSKGQSQGQKPDAQQGQGQGQDQGQKPDDQQGKGDGKGQGQGEKPGDQQGQDQGKGQDQGQGQGSQPGGQAGPGSAPGGTIPTGTGPGTAATGTGTGSNSTPDKDAAKAYQEILADVKDEAQQASAIIPNADVKTLEGIDGNSPYAQNVTKGYQVLAGPLDKLISDLSVLGVRTQREDLVKQPDLDEAPVAYRPAVSDYFENMSRDYHPDDGTDPAKKP